MSLENLTILIPTYNRHHKLKKTLRTYDALGLTTKIVVLDGSDEKTSIKNKNIINKINLNISYKSSPNTSFIDRVEKELSSYNDDDLICLGNDEDVFIPEYLKKANEFLTKNKDYSIYIGKYLNYKKSLGLFRIHYWRDAFSNCDIDNENPFTRLLLLQRVMNIGCSPIFWSVRKAGNFKKSFSITKKIELANSQELADIIFCCLEGKIKINNEIMLLRDEMSQAKNMSERDDRSDPDNIINIDSREEMINAFKEYEIFKNNEIMESYLDWYFKRMKSNLNVSFNFHQHKKSYSSLENPNNYFLFSIIIKLDRIFKLINECLYNLAWNIKWISLKRFKAIMIFKNII